MELPFKALSSETLPTIWGFNTNISRHIGQRPMGSLRGLPEPLGKCAQVDGKSYKKELYRFLRNYIATPHTLTGLPPATVLYGVQLETKVPQLFNTQDGKLLRQKDQSAKNSMKEHTEARRNIRHYGWSEGVAQECNANKKVGPKVPTAIFCGHKEEMWYGPSTERPGYQSAKYLTFPQGHHRGYAFVASDWRV